MKTALICGVAGQDGTYLANLLLSKNYEVYGTSRDSQGSLFGNLKKIGIYEKIKLLTMTPEDFRSVYVTIANVMPDEIYFLSGQSSVGLSFDQPLETIKSSTLGTLNVLEACRMINKKIKQYHASSSECFGNLTDNFPANEATPFMPRSPYAVAKASAYWLTANYREAYDLFACTGILFNHESTLRPHRFVTQKIIQSAKRIASGSGEYLELGRLDIKRDWGWAPEYVVAMWLMLQHDEPLDYVIATGYSHSLEEFVSETFRQLDLDWRQYVITKKDLYRPTEIITSRGDASLAMKKLGWKAKYKMHDVISEMLKS